MRRRWPFHFLAFKSNFHTLISLGKMTKKYDQFDSSLGMKPPTRKWVLRLRANWDGVKHPVQDGVKFISTCPGFFLHHHYVTLEHCRHKPQTAEEPCAICVQILMVCGWWSNLFVIPIIYHPMQGSTKRNPSSQLEGLMIQWISSKTYCTGTFNCVPSSRWNLTGCMNLDIFTYIYMYDGPLRTIWTLPFV